MRTENRWIRRLGPGGPGPGEGGDGGPRPALPRLVVVPHAGAGAIPYRPWAAALAGRAELWALTPPGREARWSEPALRDWGSWLAGASEALAAVADAPYALWGHSLGALGALELARARRGVGGPAALVVSGCRPPGQVRWGDPDALTDAEIVERLRELGGTPAAVLANAEIMALFLPIVRADFKLAASYRDRPGDRLDLPVTALAGLADRAAPHGEMGGWAGVTRGAFTRVLFPGDHFFPFEQGASPPVVAAIAASLP